MPNGFRRAMAATAVLAFPAVLNAAQAHAAPLPDFCVPPSVVDDVCTVRLTSVTANVVDGTITGSPVGGGAAITLAGQGDAYLKSAGFGDAPPRPGSTMGRHHRQRGQPQRRLVRSQLVRQCQGQSVLAPDAE